MTSQDKAPFNMAINTLERIGAILSDIHKTSGDPILSPEQKQFILISHVKNFFSQASPLLGQDNVNKFKERMLNLKMSEQVVRNTKGGFVKGQSKVLVFSRELEDELFNILIEVQLVLQDLKFFMPPRKDLSSAIGSFG